MHSCILTPWRIVWDDRQNSAKVLSVHLCCSSPRYAGGICAPYSADGEALQIGKPHGWPQVPESFKRNHYDNYIPIFSLSSIIGIKLYLEMACHVFWASKTTGKPIEIRFKSPAKRLRCCAELPGLHPVVLRSCRCCRRAQLRSLWRQSGALDQSQNTLLWRCKFCIYIYMCVCYCILYCSNMVIYGPLYYWACHTLIWYNMITSWICHTILGTQVWNPLLIRISCTDLIHIWYSISASVSRLHQRASWTKTFPVLAESWRCTGPQISDGTTHRASVAVGLPVVLGEALRTPNSSCGPPIGSHVCRNIDT